MQCVFPLRLRHGRAARGGPAEAVGEDLAGQEDGGSDPARHSETGENWGRLGRSADEAHAHFEAGDEVGGSAASGEEEDDGGGLEEKRGDGVGSYIIKNKRVSRRIPHFQIERYS